MGPSVCAAVSNPHDTVQENTGWLFCIWWWTKQTCQGIVFWCINFMAVISVNIIRLWFHPAGLCRSSYSEVKERSGQWCLCTAVPKKVRFIWICVDFNILINISKTLCALLENYCMFVCDCNELIKSLCVLLRFLEDKRSTQFQFQSKQFWSAVKVWRFTSGHVVTVNMPLLFPSIFQTCWVNMFFKEVNTLIQQRLITSIECCWKFCFNNTYFKW